MAATVEAFKKAFAGKVSPDLVAQRDKQVTAALKSFSEAAGNAFLDPTKANASKEKLLGLVKRFEKFKKSNLPAKAALVELDDILNKANTGVSELKQPATGSGSGGAAAGAPNRLLLLAEKKEIEEKLGKLSYPQEDADRLRLKQINAELEKLGPVPVSAPKPLPKVVSPPQVDNRPSGSEMVASEKQAKLEKLAFALGLSDGWEGDASSAGSMSEWDGVNGDPAILSILQNHYSKGFGAGLAQRESELVEAHKAYKSTGKFPKTRHQFKGIEIIEGRLMSRAERLAAMLKVQGKPYPTMDTEVLPKYIFKDELIEEVLKRANVEKQQCEADHTLPGRIRKCKEAVNDKYGATKFQDWDKTRSQKTLQQIQAVADRIEDANNSGLAKLIGKGIGRGVGYLIAGDEGAEVGDQIGGMIGGGGGVIATKKGVNLAQKRNADGGTPKPAKPPAAGQDLMNVKTVSGTVKLSRIRVSVEQVEAQKWLQEQKAADAKKPANQRRSDSELIKEARKNFAIDKRWEPFAAYERDVTVETPQGSVKYSVEDYLKQVKKAEEWIVEQKQKSQSNEGRPSASDEQLQKDAAKEFKLDAGWATKTNPNREGPRIPSAPPKGEAVSFAVVRSEGQNKISKLVESASPAAHEKMWRELGHQEVVPDAFRVGDTIYVDMSKWPKTLPRDWDPTPPPVGSTAGMPIRKKPEKGADGQGPAKTQPPDAASAGPGGNTGAGDERVAIMTATGLATLTKVQVSVEQVKAQKWLMDEKSTDARKPANQRRSDSQLIKEARGKFNIALDWEPFAAHEREVTIDTPKGRVKYSVEDYLKQVKKAEEWIAKRKENAKKIGVPPPRSDEQLQLDAASEFKLDANWASENNPNRTGPRVPAAPPKGEAVSFAIVRYQSQNKVAKLVESPSPAAHEKMWRDLGHTEAVPDAFKVGDIIYVNMSKWPAALPRDWDPLLTIQMEKQEAELKRQKAAETKKEEELKKQNANENKS